MVKLIVSGIAAAIILILAVVFWPLVSVPAGHVGIVTLFGNVQERPLLPGLAVVNPFAHVVDIETRVNKVEVSGETGTKDLQSVKAKVVVNYHPHADTAPKLYANLGLQYADRLITAAVQDRLKSVTPHFNAEELITRRDQVRLQVKTAIIDAIKQVTNGMVAVDEVQLADFGFAASFSKVIEEKQVAEQLALKAKRDLDRIKVEADQRRAEAQGQADATIMHAKAEAEAFRLKTQTLSPAMLQMAAIEKWNGELPTVTGGAMPWIQVPTKQPKSDQ